MTRMASWVRRRRRPRRKVISFSLASDFISLIHPLFLAREASIADWNRAAIEKYGSLDAAPVPKRRKLNEAGKSAAGGSLDDLALKSHVELPSADDIEKTLLQRRKEELLKRYVGS